MAQQFGLRSSLNLADVENRNECLDRLKIDKNDLSLLHETSDAGLVNADYLAMQGLSGNVEQQLASINTSLEAGAVSVDAKISRNGSSGVGNLTVPTLAIDRPATTTGITIYGPSTASFFSPASASGFSAGAEYKLGPVGATTATVSGLRHDGTLLDWGDYYAPYKYDLQVQQEPSWTNKRVPLYLPPPSQIAGNVRWFDTEHSSFVLDGSDGVEQWQDVLGRGNAVQTTAARRPVKTDNYLFDKPGVVFDPEDSQFLDLGNLSGLFPEGATAIIVATIGDPSVPIGRTAYNLLGSLDDNTALWRQGIGSGNGRFGLFTKSIQNGFPQAMPDNGTYIFTVQASQTLGLTIRSNSALSGAISNERTLQVVYDPGNAYTIGAPNRSSTSGFFRGAVYAIALFNRVLTTREVRTMEEYFAWRYDFTYDPSRTQPIELETGVDLTTEGDVNFVLGGS